MSSARTRTPFPTLTARSRPRVDGKFFFVGDEKLYLRGVTYGTFRADCGSAFPPRDVVEADLAGMAAGGVNTLRVYSVPSRGFLDAAARHRLHVLVGIPWEQHVAFLDDRRRVRAIREKVRAGVAACAGHPAVLGFAVGNEIPASIVRWAGRRRIERHIRDLYEIAKEEDPDALVTYANFPSTEYLELGFLDFTCFNVYLEEPERLRRYLARLQNLAAHRPLVLGEIGLDSRRHGEDAQARSLASQLRTGFAAGCAGGFVFAWTDEWHRGGHDVDDWDFGLTRRDRTPKPALTAVRETFAEGPFADAAEWPRVSVIVCVYNGADTLADCLSGLEQLPYPDYEVVVVDDGSTDGSAEIAAAHDCVLVRTENRGLSHARNTGLARASGEIVAYIDADARPDRHWLHYLVTTLRDPAYVGVGGPNLPCPDDGEVADSVANAPGGPIHVLLSDCEAEHIPGCNMAFRKWALERIGGFDGQFRVAGDDVDVCWRLQRRGWKLGFSPAAVVWHHQRRRIRAYWKQQSGYGRAEALLAAKWPENYNTAGQITWGGRIYARPLLYALTWTSRVYHGIWGTAPFQPRHSQPGVVTSLSATPEWYLVLAALGTLALLGLEWSPLLLALPPLALAAGMSLWRAVRGGLQARFPRPATSRWASLRRRLRTGLLFLLQPAARLRGRLASGLTPWRVRSAARLSLPRERRVSIWSEQYAGTSERLEDLEEALRRQRVAVLRGGPYDRWDLEVREGASGAARVRMCVEDHGSGRQVVHFRVWPWAHALHLNWLLVGAPALLAPAALADGAWMTAAALGGTGVFCLLRLCRQCGAAVSLTVEQIRGSCREGVVLAPGRQRLRRRVPSPNRPLEKAS